MTHALPPTSPTALRSSGRGVGLAQHPDRARARRKRGVRPEHSPLARYTDGQGRLREIVAWQGAAGSRLVVDRGVGTVEDHRLVAHLAADEPAQNAAIVCRLYLEDAPGRRGCRQVTTADAQTAPFPADEFAGLDLRLSRRAVEPVDRNGYCYRLGRMQAGMSIPELRWRRRRPQWMHGESEPVSVREAVAYLESYEPVRTLTLGALAAHRDDKSVSTSVLRVELDRVQESAIVLNRRLRNVALSMIEREGLSMSEIAIRCGRIKHDSRGNQSGETSWLARRLGILPEGGQSAPTPWVHSDVLALIARRGLGISPNEVELG
jgi:hypothetical protein